MQRWSRTASRVLECVETHCGGSPSRVVVGGMPSIPGSTMFEKKVYLEEEADYFRQFLLFEPRGSPIMMGNFILPPCDPSAAMGYVIMEQTEYPPMSGHNTICVATALLETGIIPMAQQQEDRNHDYHNNDNNGNRNKTHTCQAASSSSSSSSSFFTNFTLESPAGLIDIKAKCQNGKAESITLKNVPSFAAHLDVELYIPAEIRRGIGLSLDDVIKVDIAYGGMFYVIAQASQFSNLLSKLAADEGGTMARIGRILTECANQQFPELCHPENPDIRGVTISQLSGPPSLDNPCQRYGAQNAVIISNGAIDYDDPSTWTGVIDRSACGTGTSAKMAALHAKGQLPLHTPFPHESILGSLFIGELIETTPLVGHKIANDDKYDDKNNKKDNQSYQAVIPTITGTAHVTGFSTHVLDDDDRFPNGFTVGDIWGGPSVLQK